MEILKCPKCGREYLPAEIYIPEVFFGKPDYVHVENGKIVNFSGTDMNLEETYCCDDCDTTFIVTSKISFRTEVDNYNNFDSDYTTYIESQFSSINKKDII